MEVKTIAGIPNKGGSNDGNALNAQFNGPMGICVDSFGTLFIADSWNNSIRKLSSNGIISTIREFENLKYPNSVRLDRFGNIWVVD